MKGLTVFLKALEQLFEDKGVFFIFRKVESPTRFPAYTNIKYEVWSMDNNKNLKVISDEKVTEKITTLEEREEAEDKLAILTIKKILSHYGIQ